MDFEKIHFEGDARSAVDYIKENKCDLSYNGSVIRDGFLSTSWFECFKVVLCLELVINKVADHLAHLRTSGLSGVWLKNPLKSIVSLLDDDLFDL